MGHVISKLMRGAAAYSGPGYTAGLYCILYICMNENQIILCGRGSFDVIHGKVVYFR